MTATLYYFHDPMCSWCWGYKPEWTRLQAALPDKLKVQYVLGGLAPDTDKLMPEALQQKIISYWRKIETDLGASFNFDFWTRCQPRRATYPACRAVIAARWQSREFAMLDAIQEAYYLRAMNPSEPATLVQLARECELDAEQFSIDLDHEQTKEALETEIDFTRSIPIRGFPALVLEAQDQFWVMAIDYRDHTASLAEIQRLLSAAG